MADISVTESAIKLADANATPGRGKAGATVTPGQSVYADPSDSYKIKPALATNATQAANIGSVGPKSSH